MAKEQIETCDACGASIYPEHLADGKAASIQGRLLCVHCLTDYKKSHHVEEERFVGQSTMRAPGEDDETMEPIVLDEDAVPAARETREIRSFGGETAIGGEALQDESGYQRPLLTQGPGSTRCRTFHAKLNDGAVAFMNRQINDWADSHPDVTIKFATSTIGIWEGKKADPTLIITVFY